MLRLVCGLVVALGLMVLPAPSAQALTISLSDRSSDETPASLRCPHASPDPVLDALALQLREHARHLSHRPAHRRARIEPLAKADDRHTDFPELVHRERHAGQRPPQP